MATAKIIIGHRFNRYVVIEKSASSISRQAMWVCRCDCGTVKIVRGSHLRTGTIQSCGCKAAEQSSRRLRTHGQKKTPEYRTWSAIKRRCHNANQPNYHAYGGRGVYVCERWRDSFEAFFADMGPKPAPSYTIERNDNWKGYELGNCRWATRKEQAYNKRVSRLRPIGGCRSVAEAADRYGLQNGTLYSRLHRGWSEERALTTPVHRQASFAAFTSSR